MSSTPSSSSSITDSLTNTSQSALNTGKKFTSSALKGTRGLLGETGNIAKGSLKGATNLAKNTLDRSGRVANRLLSGDISGTLSSSKDLLTETASEISDDVSKSLDYSLHNQYVSTGIKVLLALYAAFAAPKLPKNVAMFFDSTIVRIVFCALIIFVATQDSSMAILLALAFILTLQTASKHKVINTSESVSPEGQLSWLPSLKKGGLTSEHFENFQTGEEVVPEEYAPALAQVDAGGEQINSGNANGNGNNNTEMFTSEGESLDENELNNNNNNHLVSEEVADHDSNHNTQLSADIGSNEIPGANQKSCVKSWNNQHCIQGLDTPSGFNADSLDYSHT